MRRNVKLFDWDENCTTKLLNISPPLEGGFLLDIFKSSDADIYYIERRRNHSKEKTKAIMDKMFKLFGILDTTADDCRNALRSDIQDTKTTPS